MWCRFLGRPKLALFSWLVAFLLGNRGKVEHLHIDDILIVLVIDTQSGDIVDILYFFVVPTAGEQRKTAYSGASISVS